MALSGTRISWLRCKRSLGREILLTTNTHRCASNDSTVDQKEVEFFGSIGNVEGWWKEPNVLLSMNQTRVPLIRDALTQQQFTNVDLKHPTSCRTLKGKSVLDVGCGGGILSEALVRLGASVTGIDATKDMIEAAKLHASLDPALNERLRYLNVTSSDLVKVEAESFDGVVATEVIEHVSDVESFVTDCIQLAKPGGSVFITTINQTWAAYMIAIVLAERLGPVPIGTHQYEKFVKPEILKSIFLKNECSVKLIQGQMYNVFTNKWFWTSDLSVFYAIHAVKGS